MTRNIISGYALLCVFLAGCAGVPQIKPPVPPAGMPGIYHRIETGETLWKVSKIYGIDMEDIARANHIQDSVSIETGQLLFIPKALKPLAAVNLNSEEFAWPIRGKMICSFGQTFSNMINKGINVQPGSNLDVCASRSGKVIFISDNFSIYGKTVIIDHGGEMSTVYAGNSNIYVKAGDSVRKGAVIARVNGYLHFEIRKGYEAQNPLFYLP